MGQMDEELLRRREQIEEFERERFSEETIEKEKEQSIFDGNIMVNMVPVTFAERTFLDGRASIWMPEDFTELSPREIAMSYPLGNKPDKVYSNSCLDLATGYMYTQHEVPDEYMGDFPKVVKIALERMGPKVRILSEDMRRTQKHTISSIEMISHTITEAVYNVMYFASLDGRVLMGFINFNYENVERYRSIAQEMLASFRILDAGEQDNVQQPEQAGGQPL
ncbi:MAG: hypothetical protein K2H91_02800 [Lachnospiraceae bacterium]|nr:hypothetical protein [Lachnospiraceae bacterium]